MDPYSSCSGNRCHSDSSYRYRLGICTNILAGFWKNRMFFFSHCLRWSNALEKHRNGQSKEVATLDFVYLSKGSRRLPCDWPSWRSFRCFFWGTKKWRWNWNFLPYPNSQKKKVLQKKCHHHRISNFFSFSSVKRVLGRPANFQSTVNAYAVLFITLTKLFFEKKHFFFGKKIENPYRAIIERKPGFFFSCPLRYLKNVLLTWNKQKKKTLGT